MKKIIVLFLFWTSSIFSMGLDGFWTNERYESVQIQILENRIRFIVFGVPGPGFDFTEEKGFIWVKNPKATNGGMRIEIKDGNLFIEKNSQTVSIYGEYRRIE